HQEKKEQDQKKPHVCQRLSHFHVPNHGHVTDFFEYVSWEFGPLQTIGAVIICPMLGFILLNLTPTCIQNNSRLFRKKRKNKKKRKAKESLHPKLRSSVQPLYDRTQSKLAYDRDIKIIVDVHKNFIVLIIVLINSIIISLNVVELTIK
ncbi:hypothetical protein ACJX0J_012011, partial [Zea mays]